MSRKERSEELRSILKDFAYIRRKMNEVLKTADGVNFDVALLSDDPVTLAELIAESLARLRARLDEVERAIRGRR